MNNRVNYTGFIDMFLDSEDDYEPYGVVWDDVPLAETLVNNELTGVANSNLFKGE